MRTVYTATAWLFFIVRFKNTFIICRNYMIILIEIKNHRIE